MGVIENMLDMCDVTKDVPFIVGGHGIGKSDKVADWAKSKNKHCFVLLTSTMEPGDLVGIPMIDENNATIWATPSWFKEIQDLDKKGIESVLFLDEISRGSVDTLNACLELCLNKRIHTHKLPDSCMIVSATNPANGKYRTQKLDPALINRFVLINYEVNSQEWLEWATKKNLHPAVISYISKNEEKLVGGDEKSEQTATPRSWAALSKNLQALEKMAPNNETLRTMFCGKVGLSIGSMFYSYYKEFSKNIDVEDIIKFVKSKKVDDSSEEEYQKSIESIGSQMSTKLLDGVEHINMLMLIDKLAKSYTKAGIEIDKNSPITVKKQCLPLAALLRAVPLEVAASAYKQSKDTSEMKYFVDSDCNKKLARTIATIKKNA